MNTCHSPVLSALPHPVVLLHCHSTPHTQLHPSVLHLPAAFLKSASALLYPDHIRTFMPPRPTPTPQRWAPELFHARTNSRTLFSSSPHNTSFPLPLPTSLAVCSPDCVLNHEHVLATQPSIFLETVKDLSGHAPPSSHIAVSSQSLLQSQSHVTFASLGSQRTACD